METHKHYGCSNCLYHSIKIDDVQKHIECKRQCSIFSICKPTIVEVLCTNCDYCNSSIEISTQINYMEKHLLVCPAKNDIIDIIDTMNKTHSNSILCHQTMILDMQNTMQHSKNKIAFLKKENEELKNKIKSLELNIL